MALLSCNSVENERHEFAVKLLLKAMLATGRRVRKARWARLMAVQMVSSCIDTHTKKTLHLRRFFNQVLWQDKFETEIKLMEVPVNIFPNIKGLKRMLKKKKKLMVQNKQILSSSHLSDRKIIQVW